MRADADADAAASLCGRVPILELRLPAATRLYENVRATGGGLVFATLGWVFAYPVLPPAWGFRTAIVMTLIAVVGVTVDLVLNDFQQRHFLLRVLPRGIEMQRGRYLETSMSIVPGAVLSVDVHVGPLLRRLGLARLRLNGIAQLPEVPPLAISDARAVQRLMVEQLGISGPSDGGAPWSP